jgi:hypothetical protein
MQGRESHNRPPSDSWTWPRCSLAAGSASGLAETDARKSRVELLVPRSTSGAACAADVPKMAMRVVSMAGRQLINARGVVELWGADVVDGRSASDAAGEGGCARSGRPPPPRAR